MTIKVYADADLVAQEAAAFIAAEARSAVADRGRFVMAVSGGHTPWIMLRDLAQEDVPWNGVHLLVQVTVASRPARRSRQKSYYPHESLLEHVPLRPEQIYAMPVESSDLQAASALYAQTLRSIAGSPPVLDLVHLGCPDGHTASLVPGDPVLTKSITEMSPSPDFTREGDA